jgi:hypothetical protein
MHREKHATGQRKHDQRNDGGALGHGTPSSEPNSFA